MKEFLEQLYNSLNSISVKGKNNLDVLLGCMMAIEKVIKQMEDQEEKMEETEEVANG